MILSLIIWIPVIGALLIGTYPGELKPEQSRQGAIATFVGLLIVTGIAISQYDPTQPGWQLVESVDWIPDLGLGYRLGVDGLSFPLLVLNTLLVGVAIFSTKTDIPRHRFYYTMMLLLTAGVAGAFVAKDLLLFFLFYELELIPLYFLIAIWGGARRGYAATKFLIYTALSGILIFAAFLGLAANTGFATFSYDALQEFTAGQGGGAIAASSQLILLVLILIGFGIKTPLVPLHTWLPDAHVQASTPISVLLAGVLLKLGTYGLLRFGLQLFPAAWQQISSILALWATISVLYGAFAAISQAIALADMKKMVAYSSVGHMGFILLAAAAATPESLMGAEYQMVAHGLISGLLFLLVGIIYKKTGTRELAVLGGLFNPERGLPLIGILMIMGVMASSGIPGMAGFVAEFLIFQGSFSVFPIYTLASMVGTGLTAVYFLILVNRTFMGRLGGRTAELPAVTWSERIPAIALAVPVVVFGILPQWLVLWSDSSTAALATFLEGISLSG
ncbi:MAG: NADH-quinone oxidoreductase subunit M [Cyanobacteria bacterium P01_D01_bin.73]